MTQPPPPDRGPAEEPARDGVVLLSVGAGLGEAGLQGDAHQWTTPSGRTYTQGPMKYPA